MQLENRFEVDASPDRVWELLLDVPRVVPCMPGAELTDTVSADEWKARVRVKLGPVALVFNADVKREDVDQTKRRVRLATNAREQKGRGGARATIESSVTPAATGSSVVIVTDVSLSGTVAQYGRGVVSDVSAQLTEDFANCLRQSLDADLEACAGAPDGDAPTTTADADGGRAAPTPAAAPRTGTASSPSPRQVGTLGLMLRVVVRRIAGVFQRRR